jgi:hypothetical protein
MLLLLFGLSIEDCVSFLLCINLSLEVRQVR